MKFLSKNSESVVLKTGLVYKTGNSANNRKLLKMLLAEQKSFCAYTEQYILQDDDGDYPESLDVEHFDSSKKDTELDNYYNYYAVSHKTNIRKLDERNKDAKFHKSLFFQNREELERRIQYIPTDNLYFEADENDTEAREFINFIQIDSPYIANRRKKHLQRLQSIYNAYSNKEQFINFLLKHKKDLDFITAIEITFEVDLESLL